MEASISSIFALAFRGFPIGKEPNVGGDAGVVEELFRQSDQSFQQVVLEDVTAYLTLAAGRVSGKKGATRS